MSTSTGYDPSEEHVFDSDADFLKWPTSSIQRLFALELEDVPAWSLAVERHRMGSRLRRSVPYHALSYENTDILIITSRFDVAKDLPFYRVVIRVII
jgi:hypothetical protein